MTLHIGARAFAFARGFEGKNQIIERGNLGVEMFVCFQDSSLHEHNFFITTRIPLTSFGDYSSARTYLFIDCQIWLSLAFQKTSTQQAVASKQKAELYVRARGKNTKPDIVTEVNRHSPVTIRTADIPSTLEPGAAAKGAFSIRFDDFACFRIIWVGQI